MAKLVMHRREVNRRMSEMEINRVLSQLKALSTGLDRPANTTSQDGPAFGAILRESLDNVSRKQTDAVELAHRFETGDESTSVAEVMISMQKASVSFQAMSEVRNKLVEAYREIMNMPI